MSQILPPYKCVAYTAPGVRGDLQFIGQAPSELEYSNGNSFKGDDFGHYILNNPITLNPGDKVEVEVSFALDIPLAGTGLMFLGRSDSIAGYYWLHNSIVDYRILNVSVRGGSQILAALDDAVNFTLKCIYQNNAATFYFTNWDTGEYVEEAANIVPTTETTAFIDRIGGRQGETYNLNSTEGIYNLKLTVNDVIKLHVPLCEPIKDVESHIAFNTIDNNYATLVNGSIDNVGNQDVYHYLQNGFNKYSTIPQGIDGLSSEVMVDTTSPYTMSFIRGVLPSSPTYCSHSFDDTAGVLNIHTRTVRGSTSYGAARFAFTQSGAINAHIVFGYSAGNEEWNTLDIEFLGGDRHSPANYTCLVDGISGTVTAVTNAVNWRTVGLWRTDNSAVYGFTGYEQIILDGGVVANSFQLSQYVDQYVPASSVTPGDDALGNPLTVPQDGGSYLPSGQLLKAPLYPKLINADDGNNNFVFDGGSRINIVNTDTTLNFIHQTMLCDISLDFKINDLASENLMVLFGNTTASSQKGSYMWWDNRNGIKRINCGIANGTATAYSRTDGIELVEGNWHNIRFVGNGGNNIHDIYLDGELILLPTSASQSVGSGDGFNEYSLGWGSASFYLDGGIKNVLVKDSSGYIYVDMPLLKSTFDGQYFKNYGNYSEGELVGNVNWDTDGVWYDHSTTPPTPIVRSNNYIATYLDNKDNVVFSKGGDDRIIKNITTHKLSLRGEQLYTEENVREVTPLTTNWILDGGIWDTSRKWETNNIWRTK